MESPADLLAVLPALVTALALLLSWLLLKRGLSPEPPVEASGAPEPAAVPQEAPEEPAAVKPVGAEAEEATDTGQEEELDPEGERSLPQEEPEEEDGDTFSFKYSPGKLRGNQYKQMMTKEELREEQRIELTADLTSL
ncbi:matrix-remodeling-associated protein 7 isoform X1 [Tenrec ecaudatus]|uniref:matrix-remodeling-associated protein 7 isoform X1 n=1 Tax=Tenrec ecaudatus TaxID=94439 RepID=UPI003F59C019